LYVTAGVTGTDGGPFGLFFDRISQSPAAPGKLPEAPLKAPGKIVAAPPKVRGNGTEVCENEARNPHGTGNPQEEMQVGRHRN